MIYLKQSQPDEYKIKFFTNPETGHNPVREYLRGLPDKERSKILKYAEYLRQNQGVLDEPYTRHIRDKIRELRVDFGKNRHRILFFTFVGKNIILLHAFLKKTAQTPEIEINRALTNLGLTRLPLFGLMKFLLSGCALKGWPITSLFSCGFARRSSTTPRKIFGKCLVLGQTRKS